MRHYLCMKKLLLLIFALGVVELHSQEEFFSIKGRIFSEDSLTAIHNVNIISEISRYGTTTNQEGRFFIKSKSIDTLWVSCVGFDRLRMPVSKEEFLDKELIIKLIRSDIMLDSVEIYPYPLYEDFIRDIIKMPSQRVFVPGVSKIDDEKQIYKKPLKDPPASITNPVSLIYQKFNKRERFKRKLQQNRKKFNRKMERIGADSLMIP